MALFGKKQQAGHYVRIIWNKQAERFAVGADFLKEIWHFQNETPFKKESYSEVKMYNYLRQGIPVIDMTFAQTVPAKSILIPMTEQVLGNIQLHARLK